MQNDVNKSRKCEILAPAGEYKTMLAAFNAGADAVYVGGSMFGARAFAGNFSDSELLEAIDYTHFFDKNLYLTVNTLLKDIEIEERLFEYLSPFYEAGLDAVIVQDLGVMQFEPRVSCLNPGKPSRDLLQHVSRPDSPTMAREQ